MSKAAIKKWLREKLDSIRSDLNAGNIDSAREKIQGIPLHTDPTSVFAEEIGEFYWQLEYPEMAGRYWYFIENKSPEIISACRAFERSCGDHPDEILNTLGWHLDGTPYAQETLNELQKQAKTIRDLNSPFEHQRNARDRVALIGCGLISFVLIFIFIFGIKEIIEMI